METNTIPSPTVKTINSLNKNGVQYISQDLKSYPEKYIIDRYNDTCVRKKVKDWDTDLTQDNWRQMEWESKYRMSGSCESIFSQALIQSPSWTVLKSSKSQDAITLNQNNSDQKNELECSEIVEDVVGDEVQFCQKVEETKSDGQHNLCDVSHSVSQMGNSNSEMSMSEFLPEHGKFNDERLHYFLQEENNYETQKKHEEVGSEKSQAAELVGSQKISVSLLKSILVEREFKINDLTKEVRKVQSENLHLLEERQCLLSENERLKQEVEAMAVAKERKKQDLILSFDPCSPLVLQKEISNLKNQINDLQEANESAILELAKADEEILQQRKEFAKMKSEYSQKLEDSKEEMKILKEKHSNISSKLPHPENYQEGLLKEISQLRSERRRIRAQSHQLSEENYCLKEELWDLKIQHKCLHQRNHALTFECDWVEHHGTVSVDKIHPPCGCQTEDQSLYRNDAFKVDGTFSKCKAALSSANIKEPWESKHEERTNYNASPFSMDSEATEVLIMASEDGLSKSIQTHVLGEEINDQNDEDLCSVNQNSDILLPVALQSTKTFTMSDIRMQTTKSKPNKGVFVNFSKVIMAWK
ncbi:uncharacterized protein [Engystomops pustulosus]|uniref:uncharacterized protein isoform X2 n=1 Tax=Engystomops pustulosus TaxID=76066 RepID=UPI003AFA131B